MKKRQVIRLNNLMGVDVTSHPAEVQKNRASYMLNMISDGGLNRKRHGFHQIYEFLDQSDRKERINGIHKLVSGDGKESVIIHAGANFYSEDGKKIYSDVEITDTPSQLFCVNGKSYVIGCGGLYVLESGVISPILPYVPTVYKKFDCRLESDTVWESPNVLTDKRVCIYCGTPYENDTYGVFAFPSDMDISKGATLSIEISSSKNNLYRKKGDETEGTDDFKLSFPIKAVFDLTEEGARVSREVPCRPLTHNGRDVYIFDEDESPATKSPLLIFEWEGNRFFRFNFDSSPEISGEFNIRLEYSSACEEGLYSIRSCTFGELIQDNEGKSRLAVSGNPFAPSGVYFSDSFDKNGASYFPVSCFITVDDSAPVTALMKLSNTYLGVFKRDRFFRYAFYAYPNAKNPSERIYVNGYEDRRRQGCINPYVCGKVGSDLMFFDGESVYGIEEISSETDKSFSSVRSINIERAFKEHSFTEKENAVACMHDKRYMLFIGGAVYVADTRYTFRDTSRAESYQYEWWIWSGPRASAVLSIGDRLLIGDHEGGIYVLGNDYRDIKTVRKAREGDILCLKDSGELVINREIPIDESTFVKLKGFTKLLEKDSFTLNSDTDTGILSINCSYEDIKRLREGDKIRFIINGKTPQDGYVEYVSDSDICSFSVKSETEAPIRDADSILLYENGRHEFSLTFEDTGYSLYLDNEKIFLEDISEISFIKWKNVESVYMSPMLSLDESNMTKTLYRIGISTASERSANIKFGYETRKSVMGNADGIEGLDLTSFDFDSLSFEFPFAKSFEKRVFERNFNYIMFKVASSENEDCAVRELYGVYTVNGSIKGVR
ncbi:MAG: hypothetical protein IKC74_04165 [Clostridia bacterium]|nr:hypothetical protein [Clostridia bacterium]